MSIVIAPGSLVTLTYRVSCNGNELYATPAALTYRIGAGELAESLEECLLGLQAGSTAGFDIPPGMFDVGNPNLLGQAVRVDVAILGVLE